MSHIIKSAVGNILKKFNPVSEKNSLIVNRQVIASHSDVDYCYDTVKSLQAYIDWHKKRLGVSNPKLFKKFEKRVELQILCALLSTIGVEQKGEVRFCEPHEYKLTLTGNGLTGTLHIKKGVDSVTMELSPALKNAVEALHDEFEAIKETDEEPASLDFVDSDNLSVLSQLAVTCILD